MKLEVVHPNDQDKVQLAVQQVKGSSLAWWQNYRDNNATARTMVWKDFVDLFNGHHIPKSAMKMKRREFMDLRQRGMTVT